MKKFLHFLWSLTQTTKLRKLNDNIQKACKKADPEGFLHGGFNGNPSYRSDPQ